MLAFIVAFSMAMLMSSPPMVYRADGTEEAEAPAAEGEAGVTFGAEEEEEEEEEVDESVAEGQGLGPVTETARVEEDMARVEVLIFGVGSFVVTAESRFEALLAKEVALTVELDGEMPKWNAVGVASCSKPRGDGSVDASIEPDTLVVSNARATEERVDRMPTAEEEAATSPEEDPDREEDGIEGLVDDWVLLGAAPASSAEGGGSESAILR